MGDVVRIDKGCIKINENILKPRVINYSENFISFVIFTLKNKL